jgi:recombination protein RecA
MIRFCVFLQVFGILPTGAAFVVRTNLALSTSSSLHAKSSRKSASSEEPGQGQDPAKQTALNGVLNQIERLYGRGSIVKLGDADSMRVSCIGSGSLTLDAAMGGGYPKGR